LNIEIQLQAFLIPRLAHAKGKGGRGDGVHNQAIVCSMMQ